MTRLNPEQAENNKRLSRDSPLPFSLSFNNYYEKPQCKNILIVNNAFFFDNAKIYLFHSTLITSV